jgi:hypothetical protein
VAEVTFDAIVLVLGPLLEARGFTPTAADDASPPGATFSAGIEAVRIGWDADLRAFTLEAREPEYEGSWADIALFRIRGAVADEQEAARMVGIFREALAEYFASLES